MVFFLSTALRVTLVVTVYLYCAGHNELFSWRQNGRCVILTPYLQLVPSFRMRGDIPPHLYTSLFYHIPCSVLGLVTFSGPVNNLEVF